MTQGVEVAIIGAGGFGREVLQYCADAQKAGWPHRVVGFVDDRSDALDAYDIPVPVLCGLGDIGNISVAAFIIALGDPVTRGVLAKLVEHLDRVLVSLIHPTAYLAPTAQIGAGVVLCPFTLVAARATVGPNVAVNVYSSIGHDAHVGEHSVMSPYSAVTGDVSVGGETFLGTNCSIAPGTKVGYRSKISAGSVVTHDAEAGSLLIGNPAKGRVMYSVT